MVYALKVFVGVFAILKILSPGTDVRAAENQSVAEDQPKKWGANYFNYMNGPMFSDANGASINHLISLKHIFDPIYNLSVVFRPDSNFGNGESFVTLGDSYLKLGINAYRSRKLKVSPQLRYYAPMSQQSQDNQLMGVVQPRVYVSSSEGRFDFLYILIPSVYLASSTFSGQPEFAHGHWLGTNYRLSDQWTLDFALYPKWSKAQGAEPSFNDLVTNAGFSVSLAQNFKISPYLEFNLLQPEASTTYAVANVDYTFF